MTTPNIYSVSQLNYSVRHLLEGQLGMIWLSGEISNFSQPVSGHWYLTLKDSQAQVRCAMFKLKNQRVSFRPQNGMQVLVRAAVSLYEPRGDYQLILESMQPAGEGLLQQKFDELKLKLNAEGLFDQAHKQPLPKFVKRVGVVTSANGAALQDILNILKRRDPSLEVVIYPTLVQGKEAAGEIAAMIELANRRQECEVLIVGRGGGSLEDLWCFNEEIVARAIFASHLPIISAVGHETDVTIADFVADLRAPTPSAAAELISRDQQELALQLHHRFQQISQAFDRLWGQRLWQFEQLQLRLKAQHPAAHLQRQQQRYAEQQQRLLRAMSQLSQRQAERLSQLHFRLQTQNPLRQIERQRQQLSPLAHRLQQQLSHYLPQTEQKWQHLLKRLAQNPLPFQLQQFNQQQDRLHQRLQFAMEKRLLNDKQRFAELCTKLDGLSPLKILNRGYSITQKADGEVLHQASQVEKGEMIVTQLAHGKITSQVI